MITCRYTVCTAYVGLFTAATLGTGHLGPVPVGSGLLNLVGPILGVRAVPHTWAGDRVAWLTVLAGMAFAVSETVGELVFTARRRRARTAAVCSGLAGIVADSVVSVWSAYGSWNLLTRRILGEAYAIPAASVLSARPQGPW